MSDFHGLLVALATPFDESGRVDEDALRRLVRHVAGGGADALVPLGSTGEAATLEPGERDLVIRVCLEEAGRARVVAGTGSNDTRAAARMTARAYELGAHGALSVVPYYNKPMPQGIVRHFEEVARAAPDLPLIAYNVPGRTGTNMTPDTLERVFAIDTVVAVKESSGDLAQIAECCRRLRPGRRVLSGDDNLCLPAIAVGATGLVSVLGNLLPAEMKALVDHAVQGRLEQARAEYLRLLPLMNALFTESNPIALKAGLDALGICGPAVRLPLSEATDRTREVVGEALREVTGVRGKS